MCGFFRLWACDNVPPFETVESLADCDRLFLKINISRRERKQFAGTHTAPVEHFKRIIRTWLIHYGFGEFQIFLFRPKIHFLDGFAPNRPRPSCRIVGQVVKVYCMVEYRRKLCMNCPQIICGIGLAFLVPVSH